jgi:predicted nucleic acid-binding protein
MKAVIDASVAIKWHVFEEDWKYAHALLTPKNILIAPDFMLLECANILWKKVLRGDISQESAQEAVRYLKQGPIHFLPTIDFTEQALQLSHQLNHPVYDCLYLACAIEQQAFLLTADLAFHARVQNSEWKDRIRKIDEIPD